MSFALYMIGVLLLVGGLIYGATVLGVSQTWIGVFAAIVVGLGIMGAVARTRQKDPQ